MARQVLHGEVFTHTIHRNKNSDVVLRLINQLQQTKRRLVTWENQLLVWSFASVIVILWVIVWLVRDYY